MNEELPAGWAWAKLQDIVFPGETRNPSQSAEPYFLYVDIEALDNSQQRIASPKKLPSGQAPGRARLVIRAKDVIFSLTRPYLKNIAIVPPDLDNQIASTAYCVMRPENGISSEFVFYFINRDDFIKSIPTYGDSPPAAHDDEFLAMEVPLAPTNEQARIVAAIEQQFTRIDNAVASLKSAQAKAKQFRASLLKAAVEGELTKEWRASNSSSETGVQLLKRILDKRRELWEEEQLAKMRERGETPWNDEWKKKYKEPKGPDVANLPELPEGWCWATLDQVTVRSEYGTSVKCDYNADGVPVLRIPNIAAGSIDLTDLKYATQPILIDQNSALQVGDLLICRTNGSISLVGKAALVKAPLEPLYTFASYLLRFRFYETSILPAWMHLFIGSNQGRVFIESHSPSSAGQHNISLSLLHSMVFPLPPLAEQAQIIAEVEAQFSEMAQMEETIEHSLRRAEQERQSILRDAFAGRLVPQDPADEPASELLERIREERRKREEAEKEREKERRKGAKRMAGQKKGQAYKNDRERIYYTLREAETPMKPEELFKRAGFEVDKQPESVEEFQAALTPLEIEEAIKEERPDDNTVVLRAIELPEEQLQALFGGPENEEEEDKPEDIYEQLSLLDEADEES